jgi:2-oxoisovalerate dehydrogenase E2 component (dihydrolipoyl transacylase)
MIKHVFNLPDIGEGMAEAELVAWHVKVGDYVAEDQPVADVMTDKATVELTAPVAGTILKLHGMIGKLAQVGAPLVEFDTAQGANPSAVAADAPGPIEAAPSVAGAPALTHQSARQRPQATPAVRKRAADAGIALEDVRGSGPNGRIRQADLDAYLAYRNDMLPVPEQDAAIQNLAISNPTPAAGYRDVPLIGMRRRIAEKMEIATRRIPHFSYIEEVDVTQLEITRQAINDRYGPAKPKLSFLPFLARATCLALAEFPYINARFDDEAAMVREFDDVHLGIATQTDAGLMVPVVRSANRRDLWELAEEIQRLAEAARRGSASRNELAGSTITITSLGLLGGLSTTPVINHPEVAIIGPNRIIERPVAQDGSITLRKIMNISSSFDHRIVDGYNAAQFIQSIRTLLEDPVLMLR